VSHKILQFLASKGIPQNSRTIPTSRDGLVTTLITITNLSQFYFKIKNNNKNFTLYYDLPGSQSAQITTDECPENIDDGVRKFESPSNPSGFSSNSSFSDDSTSSSDETYF